MKTEINKINKIIPETAYDSQIKGAFNFIVKDQDEPDTINWYDAMAKYDNNPNSEWRLPTRVELLIMYEHKDEIGGFDDDDCYWSSSEYSGYYAWHQRFHDGNQNNYYKRFPLLVRLVKKG